MKRLLTLTIAIMMFVAVVAITAEAQVSGVQRLRARIPFAFNVGAKSFPAGDYTIAVINPTSDRKALQIRSADGRLSAIVQTNVSAIVQTNELNARSSCGSSSPCVPEHAKLVFNRYGERYFFAQAQMGADASALSAVKSNAERNTEQAVANERQKATVAIVRAM